VCVLLITAACAAQPHCPYPVDAATHDLRGVLAAVMAHAFPDADKRHLAVDDRLGPDDALLIVPPGIDGYDPEAELLRDLRRWLPRLRADTAADFVRRQRGPEPLPPGMKWPARATLGWRDGFEDWETFYREHPGSLGIATIAPVGFSADGHQALVLIAHLEDYEGGSGDAYVLELVGGTWHVIQQEMIWVA